MTMHRIAPMAAAVLCGTGTLQAQVALDLTDTDQLRPIGVQTEVVQHEGRTGLRVTRADDYAAGGTLVLVEGSELEDGVIEIELAGEPAPGADPAMRGFVGIAFRIDTEDPGRYECFYLRPVNGRAADQLQRNHSTQYVSHPEYGWARLRREAPGVYESYVDLVPGAWTKVRIEVDGKRARLFVHGSDQPVLLVNELKHGRSSGQVGLWLHESTVAHFRNLRVTPAR